MWFELYTDSCRKSQEPWRWRLRDSDETVIATSTRGYANEESCRQAITLLKRISDKTPMKIRPHRRLPDIFMLLK